MSKDCILSILYIKKSRAKRHPQFVNRQSSFHEVSYERFRGQKPDDRIQRGIEDRGQKLDFFYMLYALCSMPFMPAPRNT